MLQTNKKVMVLWKFETNIILDYPPKGGSQGRFVQTMMKVCIFRKQECFIIQSPQISRTIILVCKLCRPMYSSAMARMTLSSGEEVEE